MKAPHLSPVPDPPVAPSLVSLWFDGSPVEPGLQLLPPSQRFDARRPSVQALLGRMALGSDRVVHFDAGWDPIAQEVERTLAAIDAGFTIRTAAALWAELRIVTSIDAEPGVRRILREAAGESMTRCERCGLQGRPVRCMPRQRTLCHDHAAEHRFDEAVRMTVEKLRAQHPARSA